MSGLSSNETQLLRTAACYHDLAFIERRNGHEHVSARIAAKSLPSFGFEPKEVTSVIGMILATRLPQSPQNLLEQLMADADLNSLGRADFFERNQALRDEMAAFEHVMSDRLWYRNQLIFLQSHHYWTRAAASLRDPAKEQHIAELIRRVATATRANYIEVHFRLAIDDRRLTHMRVVGRRSSSSEPATNICHATLVARRLKQVAGNSERATGRVGDINHWPELKLNARAHARP